jgi:hypothetical protein
MQKQEEIARNFSDRGTLGPRTASILIRVFDLNMTKFVTNL